MATRTMIYFLSTYASRISNSKSNLAEARQESLEWVIENEINQAPGNHNEAKKEQYAQEFKDFIRKIDRHFSAKEMYTHLSTLAGSFCRPEAEERAIHLYNALDNPTQDTLQQLIESAKVQDKITINISKCSNEKMFDEAVSTCTSAALFLVQVLLAPIALVLALAVGSALSCAFEKFKFYEAAQFYIEWIDDSFNDTKKHADSVERNYKWVTFDEISQSAIALQGFFGKSTAHYTTGGNITEYDRKNAEASEAFMAPEAYTVR